MVVILLIHHKLLITKSSLIDIDAWRLYVGIGRRGSGLWRIWLRNHFASISAIFFVKLTSASPALLSSRFFEKALYFNTTKSIYRIMAGNGYRLWDTTTCHFQWQLVMAMEIFPLFFIEDWCHLFLYIYIYIDRERIFVKSRNSESRFRTKLTCNYVCLGTLVRGKRKK